MLLYVTCSIIGLTWIGVFYMVKQLYNFQQNAVYWDDMPYDEKKEYLDDELAKHMSYDPRRRKKES